MSASSVHPAKAPRPRSDSAAASGEAKDRRRRSAAWVMAKSSTRVGGKEKMIGSTRASEAKVPGRSSSAITSAAAPEEWPRPTGRSRRQPSTTASRSRPRSHQS